MQPRFGHISSCKPHSDYLSVPDVRKKCYKIPPENELCLCEDIFQQHQAKLVNCDIEDAIAVETYKEPNFDSNENVCDDDNGRGSNGEKDDDCSGGGEKDDGRGGNGDDDECCCGDGGDESSRSSSSCSSVGATVREDGRKGSEVSSSSAVVADMAVQPYDGGGDRQPTEKLTAEERAEVLRELDDIVTGNFLAKVRRFSQDVQSDSSDDLRHRLPLQTTCCTAAARLRGKRSSSLDTDEIVNYGKVAELTRRFSRLGEAGVIAPQHYCSEPNFFGESVRHRYYRHDHSDDQDDYSSGHDDDVGGDGDGGDYEVVRQPIRMVFIRPMSVSVDDRLNTVASRGFSSGDGGGGGVVLTEVTSDGETAATDARRTLSATQTRRLSFRKSVAFDSSLSSIDGDCAGSGDGRHDNDDDETTASRYLRLKGGGGWQSVTERATAVGYNKSSDTVCVSNLVRAHRRYSSVDVYDQVKAMFLDVEKTEKEFRDSMAAEKNRRREAIRDYLANKELLMMKMKSASVGGILRWNQEHQDTLLDDEDPSLLLPPPPPSPPPPPLDWENRSPSSSDEGSPKDVLRRVLRTGLKGRRIRRLRKLESRSSGFAVADLWRVSKDEPPTSSSAPCHSTGCSSAEPPDNHNTTL